MVRVAADSMTGERGESQQHVGAQVAWHVRDAAGRARAIDEAGCGGHAGNPAPPSYTGLKSTVRGALR